MGRRIYYLKPKKEKQKQEFMRGYRNALQNIDPELIETARDALAEAIARLQENTPSSANNMVPVDNKKNLSIIAKYLESQTGNKEIKSKIKEMLSE